MGCYVVYAHIWVFSNYTHSETTSVFNKSIYGFTEGFLFVTGWLLPAQCWLEVPLVHARFLSLLLALQFKAQINRVAKYSITCSC